MNSKKKGSRFELFVSKWLTKWSGYKFQRTPYSGANHFNRELASDIMCSDPKHQFKCKISVECKSYKDIKFEHVLLGNKGSDINKFWAQASRDAKRANKVPVLCMRYNSMPRNEFFFVISAKYCVPFYKLMGYPYLSINMGDDTGEVLMVFMATKVMANVSYKEFHKYIKSN